ncbi:unnamed protein product [Amoebophrya sp. A25]|nr:unnamed protein product [Amoebophrya sp. A25]|eukprot:GSA25T00023123001.1
MWVGAALRAWRTPAPRLALESGNAGKRICIVPTHLLWALSPRVVAVSENQLCACWPSRRCRFLVYSPTLRRCRLLQCVDYTCVQSNFLLLKRNDE